MAKAKEQTDTTAAVPAPKMVTVEALEWHTYEGNEYDVGDTYDIDEQFLDSLIYQGKAVRADRVEVAKTAKREQAAAAKRSQSVEPMGTTSRGTRALAKPRSARKARG